MSTDPVVTGQQRSQRPRIVASGIAALAGLALFGDAQARSGRESSREEYVQSRLAGPPVMAVVSLRRQRVTIYDAAGWTMRAPVSTGRAGYETPAGIFSILQRKAEHYSNLYDDAAMPFMQRLTWSGIALHGGELPGRPASHGCVRLPHGFAERLFEVTRLGMRVIVMPEDIAPAAISHPRLFKPAAEEETAQRGVGAQAGMIEPVSLPSGVSHRSLRAIAAAKTVASEEAARTLEQARVAAAAKAKDASLLNRALRVAQSAWTRAEARLREVEHLLGSTSDPEAFESLGHARAGAAEHASQTQAQLESVQAEAKPTLDELVQLRAAAVAARRAKAAADEEARVARRRIAPVSVFISRTSHRLYVRQAFQPLFESDVTIADPGTPLGTYVFTALAFQDGESNLTWNAVSMYGEVEPARAKPRGAVARPKPDPLVTDVEAAAAVLDRITVPAEARARIEAIISPGSSLIISDEPLSRETGTATEFVVVMSGEPQGGIKIRRRDDEVGSRSDRLFRGRFYSWGRPF